jgi:hypothetical protein
LNASIAAARTDHAACRLPARPHCGGP